MDSAIYFFLEHGSYGLMFAWIIAAGLGLPLPEDIAMISGAILAQRGVTDLATTVAVLSSAVLLGDTILYFIARRLGPAIYERKFIARVMPPERRLKVEEMIRNYGSFVVFGARHIAGVRGAIFAMCAIHGISYPRFIIADALALAISMPVFMAIGWLFSDSVDQVLSNAASFRNYIMIAIGGIALLVGVVHLVRVAMKRAKERKAEETRSTNALEK
jgi:membrane protein DedA with SNARE-associated domain